jgi:antitoxin (DNA-binding transcriptional repressor) of toxin-antitoxin stability system
MERHEIPVDDRTQAWLDAIERGDEVVLTRDGRVVAEIKVAVGEPIVAAILAARAKIPDALKIKDAAALVRAMRDQGF